MTQRIGRSAAWIAALALFVAGCSSDDPPADPPRPKPTAHLTGPGGMHTIGDRVVVDGEGSTGRGELEFQWTLHRPDGSEAAFEFENRSRNAFTVDVGGTFEVELVVVDQGVASDPATFQVSVAYEAPIPALEIVAPEPTIALDHEVVADASGSVDPVGRPLQYTFRLTKRPTSSTATLQVDGATARFAPDRGGVYEVGVKVGNDTTWSEEITREIQVQPPRNRAPVANAGSDRADRVGREVVLDGSGSSDPDEDELTYAWSFLSRPEGSTAEIAKADEVQASFVPDLPGDYHVELEVSDGEFTATDSIRIGAVETVNNPPLITQMLVDGTPQNKGAMLSRPLGSEVAIQVEVFDPDQDPLTIHWELTRPDDSDATLGELAANRRTLEADVEGIYVVTVVVNDGELDSEPASLSFRFRGDNKLPVAVLTTPDGVHAFPNGTEIVLDGSQSYDTDMPPDAIEQYRFSLVQQPTGMPNDSLSQEGPQSSARFILRKKTTDRPYRFQLVVVDGLGGVSEPTTLEIQSLNRPPVARAPSPQISNMSGVTVEKLEPEHPRPGTSVVLMGNFANDPSTDPDGDTLTYSWTIIDAPAGSNPVLTPNDGSDPQTCNNVACGFYTDMPGDYTAQLTVSDNDPTNPGTDTTLVEITINE